MKERRRAEYGNEKRMEGEMKEGKGTGGNYREKRDDLGVKGIWYTIWEEKGR